MIYVGEKHTATRSDADLQEFACTACGRRALALVIGIGQGVGNSPFYLDGGGAAERAASSARRAADANAALTLSLARCPACGRRDGAAVTRFWTRLAARAIGVVLVMWAIGGLLYLVSDPLVMWILGPLAPLLAPAVVWQEWWKWSTVDQRVAFVPTGAAAPAETLSSPASLQPGG